jgi:hypothetical protein
MGNAAGKRQGQYVYLAAQALRKGIPQALPGTKLGGPRYRLRWQEATVIMNAGNEEEERCRQETILPVRR